jgi:phosphoglycerol transferase MdoB-like AlkP superfamily enzyme
MRTKAYYAARSGAAVAAQNIASIMEVISYLQGKPLAGTMEGNAGSYTVTVSVSETEINNPKIKGGFISDDVFIDQIINEFEKKADRKIFIFGLSMQNHKPYNPNKYDDYDIEVYSNNLSEKEIGEFQAYSQGLYDADKSLGKLINYLSNYDEPTVLLFFGDHLPSFESDNDIYDKLNYPNGEIDKYTTPFLIWSNYDSSRDDIKIISSNFLGNELLNYIDITKNSFFEFLDEVNKEIIAIKPDLLIDSKGNIINSTTDKTNNLENIYINLQYYLLIDKYK